MARLPNVVTDRWRPISDDPSTALTLLRAAVEATPEPGVDPNEEFARLAGSVRRGAAHGGILEREGRPVGLILWHLRGPLGVSVSVVYCRPSEEVAVGYRDLLAMAEREEGPLVFLPSPLPGLRPEEERRLLEPFGFRRFARLEMEFPESTPLPPETAPAGGVVRAYRREDELSVARIHAAAFDDSFDRYLFFKDPDPARDGELSVRDIVGGQYGEFLEEPSTVVDLDGRAVGVVLALRTNRGVLLADVAVDPPVQGRGVARAAIARTLRVAREYRVSTARLVVTVGNRRAIELYQRLGFVPSLGPLGEWYNAHRVPVGPDSG